MAMETADALFESKLDEASKKKAKDELNELNDRDRESAVQTLRKWVLEQDWLRSPTDFGFLLRFLRIRKYSQLVARDSIVKYWTSKTKSRDFSLNLDPADENVLWVFKSGFFCSSKTLDKEGRRWFINRTGAFDVAKLKEIGVLNFYKAFVIFFEWLARDENIQVNGLCGFGDFSNTPLAIHTTIMATENGRKHLEFFDHCLPCRVKGMHAYNEPAFFDVFFVLLKLVFSKKTTERLTLYGNNLVKVYDKVDKEVLPREYLPDEYDGPCIGTYFEIVDEMVADMLQPEFRNYLKELSSDKYGVDLEKIPNKDDTPSASFRKLNVD